MDIWLDGCFWSDHFNRVFVPQINAFSDAITNRLLPTFVDIEREADDFTRKEYERLSNLPSNGNNDMAVIAEEAQEAGVAYYQVMENTRQCLINLVIVGIYHMLEQQLLFFHRRQVLKPAEEDDISKIEFSEFKKRLATEGRVDIESLKSWPKINELKLVADSVKHAEGRSSEELKKLRPDLFASPCLRPYGSLKSPFAPKVYLPLSGQDIYLTVDDLMAYQSAVVSFLKEFADTIRKHNR